MVLIPCPKFFSRQPGVVSAVQDPATFRLSSEVEFLNAETVRILEGEVREIAGGDGCIDSSETIDFTVSLKLADGVWEEGDESYRLTIGKTIEVHARSVAGFLYAMATLRQLRRMNAQGVLVFPRCKVEDRPDVPYRFASRWLLEIEATRMAYDWGDGREKMLERYRRKIDFCMRYKINAVFFEGFEWKTDKYPGYIDDIRALNAYARARNVRLTFGGHVIGFGGFPGHQMEGAMGLGGFNRLSYPDGAIYDCGRVPGGFDPTCPPISSDAMRNGTCRSNDALNRLKQTDLVDYVRKIEPGVLYLHSEDISLYEHFQRMWEHRCEACRRRWPSDEVACANGAAGAIAHGFRYLYDGIASVRNPETDYDGARDCLVIFASPSYGHYYESDADWKKISDFWTAVSKELGRSDHILFCMREQFWSVDGSERRLPELAKRLEVEGGGHGLFVFAVGGADHFNNHGLFSAASRLNHFYEGAKAVFNFNGGLFSPVQEIYNSESTWNLRSPFGVDEAVDHEAAKAIYRERSEKMVWPPKDELLQRALWLCYGEAASTMEAFYHLRGSDNQFPLAIPYLPCRQLFAKRREEHDRTEQRRKWGTLHEISIRAQAIIREAMSSSLPDLLCAEELHYLERCLEIGIRFSALVADLFEEMPDFNHLRDRLRHLKTFVREDHPMDFTSTYEGVGNLWLAYLDQLDGFMASPTMKP